MKATHFFFAGLAGGLICFYSIPARATAPLTWFPAPPLFVPFSGAASVVVSGYGNVVIGGDGDYPYPEYLQATNQYWGAVPMAIYNTLIAPGAVASGGMIVLYGGTDGTTAQSTAIGYSTSDPATSLPSMSVARAYLGYAPDASGTAYALGGLDDLGNPLASCESFNQDNNAWQSVAALPVARYDFPAVFDGTNRIYVFGGLTNTIAGGETDSVLYYSTRQNQWTAVARMPVATAGSAAARGKDGKIYVAGGRSGGVATDVVQVYDPVANSWTLSTPLPEALSEASMGTDSMGRLLVIGGMDVNGVDVADVWRSEQLGVPDSAPVLTQLPGTNATYLQPYASAIGATGNPEPTYLLISGPATMTVDPYSGAISWTPQAGDIGTDSITLRATNYAGYVDYKFSVTVPNPPPTAVSNITVGGVTDTTVTLSWSPEPAVVGPVTYGAYLRHVLHDPKGSGATVWYTGIGTPTSNATMTISGLAPGTSESYFLAATGPGGSSGYTSAIAATTTAPQGPTNLWVTAVTPTSVSLAWTPAPGPEINANYSPIVSYAIMERDMAYYPPVNVPTVLNISGTNGTITGLQPGGSHLWFVSGVDAAGYASAMTWIYVTVTNPPVPKLTATVKAGSGGFQLTASQPGAVNEIVTIQASSDPSDPASWATIGSVAVGDGPFTFTDTNSAQYPVRFYRVVTP